MPSPSEKLPVGRTRPRWRLATLADFWRMARWLDEQHRRNHSTRAFDAYLSRLAPILREGTDRYSHCLRRLDACSGGILSNPETVQRLRLPLPEGRSLLEHFERIGDKLRRRFDELQNGPAGQDIAEWRRLLDNTDDYRAFVTRLIHQFGNYEVIALALPGTGPIITRRRVQSALGEMFAIKRRLIRLLELAYGVRRAWQADPPRSSLGFFNPQTDMSQLVRGMVAEYMVQADPQRVKASCGLPGKPGRRHATYRFWRPAEALRQMADVEYQAGPKRIPRPRRNYVDLRINPVAPVCADTIRLEWAIKELFNNAIGATSIVTVSGDGQGLIARPIEKHARADPPPAIILSVLPVRRRSRLRTRHGVRVIIADDGVGIDETVLRYVTLWAFSTHRDWVDAAPDEIIATPSIESDNTMIGGKGIGLAFAQATIRELGGELHIASRLGGGTELTVDLPTPTLN